eukprot:4224320-Prymnesium_polylepis.1
MALRRSLVCGVACLTFASAHVVGALRTATAASLVVRTVHAGRAHVMASASAPPANAVSMKVRRLNL